MADLKRTLEVEISAVADKFTAGIGKASQSLGGFDKSLGKAFDGLDKSKGGLENIGRAASALQGPLLAAGAALTAFGAAGISTLAGSVSAARDFETAFTGVRKTVDASPAEFAALEKGIREMALEIPVAATELAGIGEIAGQLGIKKEGILDFTRTIAALGVTTNLSAEEAAVGLARFINISDATQAEVSNLGSAIVALGNNSETSEKEILNMATRMALAGTQAGLSAADILAFSASLSSAGISAELGGTNFSKFITNVTNGVRQGGADLERFAAIVGMTTAEFKQKFETDAAGAITLLLGKLDEAGPKFGTTSALLEKLGFTGEETQRAVLALSTRTQGLSGDLDRSSTSFAENIALAEEAALRYATTDSQLQIFRNTIVDIGYSIGDALLPALNGLLDAVKPVVTAFADFARDHSTITAAAVTIAGGLATLALGFGGVTVAVGLLAGSVTTLLPILSGLGLTALPTLGSAAITAKGAMAVLGTTAVTAAAAGAAAFAGWKLGEWAAKNIPLVERIGDMLASDIIQASKTLGFDWTGEQAGAEAMGSAMRGLHAELVRNGIVVKRNGRSMEDWNKAMADAARKLVDAKKKAGDYGKELEKTGKETSELDAYMKKLIAAIKNAAAGADDAESKVFDMGKAMGLAAAEVRGMEAAAEAGATRIAGMALAADSLELNIGQVSTAAKQAAADVQSWTQTAADSWDAAAAKAAAKANEIDAAFSRMGISTRAELSATADQAERDFDHIAGSGQASAESIDEAWMTMLEARKAALIANGSDLGEEEQKILDDLKRRQQQHATDTKGIWETWAEGIDGLAKSLDIGGKIFSGQFAPGKWKDTLKGIAKDFLDVFVSPLKNWINDLVEKWLKKLADALFDIGGQVSGLGGAISGGSGGGGGALGGALGGGGGGGGAGGLFNMVTGAITAGASVADAILSHFGRRRAESTANATEENTRTHMLLFADYRKSVGFFQNDELQEQTANLEYIVANTDDMKGALWSIRDALTGGIMVAGLVGGLAAGPAVAGGDLGGGGLGAPSRSRTSAPTVVVGGGGFSAPIRGRTGEPVVVSGGGFGAPTRSRSSSRAQFATDEPFGTTFASFGVDDRQRILDLANEVGRLSEIFGPGVHASQGVGLSQTADISAFLDEIGFNDQATAIETTATTNEQIVELLRQPLEFTSPAMEASLAAIHESIQRPVIINLDGREIARITGDIQAGSAVVA